MIKWLFVKYVHIYNFLQKAIPMPITRVSMFFVELLFKTSVELLLKLGPLSGDGTERPLGVSCRTFFSNFSSSGSDERTMPRKSWRNFLLLHFFFSENKTFKFSKKDNLFRKRWAVVEQRRVGWRPQLCCWIEEPSAEPREPRWARSRWPRLCETATSPRSDLWRGWSTDDVSETWRTLRRSW